MLPGSGFDTMWTLGQAWGSSNKKLRKLFLCVCFLKDHPTKNRSIFFCKGLSILGEGGIELSFLFGGNSEDDQLEISN